MQFFLDRQWIFSGSTIEFFSDQSCIFSGSNMEIFQIDKGGICRGRGGISPSLVEFS